MAEYIQTLDYSNDSRKLREIMNRKKHEFDNKFKLLSTVTEDSDLELNQVSLKDFNIHYILGTGTFATVVLAELKTIRDTKYAIKILRKERIIECKQRNNILNEKKVLHALNCPFIIKLAYTFKDNSNLYLVLEYTGGGEMFTHLRKMQSYSESTACFYASQIIIALEYLHYLNIIYRNLIPENILFNHDGYIKLGDFGLSKLVDGRTFTLCGTPDYLAPEIIAKQPHNKDVDWWALGILIFEMMAGYPPFYHEDPLNTYALILKNVLTIPKNFSKSSIDLINGLLESAASKRLGSKHDAEDLKRHEWFKDVDWLNIYEKKVKPPYVPSEEFEKSDYVPFKVSTIEEYENEFADF